MFRFTIRDVLWLMVAGGMTGILSVGISFGTIALCDCAWEAANKSFGHLSIHPGWFK